MFTLSQNGTLVYVPANGGGRLARLAWVDRTGREELLPLSPRPYMEPRLSPDGSRLAVAEVDTDLNADIRIYDVARYTLVKRLTTSLGQDRGPVWPPGGERIYIWSGDGGMDWKDVEGGGSANLLKEFGFPQTLSPDGRTLVYVTTTAETGHDLWTVSVDGGTTAALFDTSFSEAAAAISAGRPMDRLCVDGDWAVGSVRELLS